MIPLHRLRGERFLLNPDLIESVEAAPDTVVTLVDGRKVYVAEDPDDLADLVVRHRAAVLSACDAGQNARTGSAELRLLTTPEE